MKKHSDSAKAGASRFFRGNTFRLSLFVMLLCCASVIYAQEKEPALRVFVGKDKISLADSAKMYKTLLANSPFNQEFKYEPHFAIVGFKDQFYFSSGVRLRFTAALDWGNPVNNATGMGVDMLEPVRNANKQLFQMSAGSSQIYFNIVGFPNTQNKVGLFVSLNLDADADNSYRVKVSQIYMKYRNITCGYMTSLYDDRVAAPYVINSKRPASSSAHSSVGINYQHDLGKHIAAGIGVEMPKVSYTHYHPADSTKWDAEVEVNQRIPSFPMYVRYAWNEQNHIRLSGILRPITYYDHIAEKTSYVLSWGLKLSSKLTAGKFDFFAIAQGGCGITNLFTATNGAGMDLLPSDKAEALGVLKPTYSIGALGTVQYNFSPKVFASATASVIRNFATEYTTPAERKYKDLTKLGLTVNVNAVWHISELFSTGIEGSYALRKAFGESSEYNNLHNNRICGVFMMNF